MNLIAILKKIKSKKNSSNNNKQESQINRNNNQYFSPTSFGIFLLGFVLNFGTINSCAQGNLLITPRRVVFEGSKKIQ